LVNNLLNEIENKRKFTTIDSLIVGLLGDAIGGLIHDELRETNECSAIDAIIKAKEILINCINTIIDKGSFNNITFLCNRGNHSRISHKMTYSNESAQSLETFLYVSLKDYYRLNKKIRFEIPESGIGYFTIKNDVFNENFILRFFHGWQIKSNGGIGGITIPLNKYIYKLDETRKANHTILGHFHNLSYPSLNITLNGSVKGMDAFAVQHGFSYQRPMQGLIYYSVKDNAINERTIIYCDK
jgi:hypothetical protein